VKSFDDLKKFIVKWVHSRIPGLLPTLNVYSRMKTGRDFIDLLLEQPSKAYSVLLDRYKDPASAEFALVTLFLKPIAVYFERLGLEYQLLELAKSGRDKEFIETIKSLLSSK